MTEKFFEIFILLSNDVCEQRNSQKFYKDLGIVENRLWTPFKIQVGSQITRLQTIGKLNCQTKGNCSTDSSAVVSGNCLSKSK